MIAKSELVKALHDSTILINDLLRLMHPELYDEQHVRITASRVADRGGTLFYAATIMAINNRITER